MGHKYESEKRMNRAEKRSERRDALREVVRDVEEHLQRRGYEPLVEWNGLWLPRWKVERLQQVMDMQSPPEEG